MKSVKNRHNFRVKRLTVKYIAIIIILFGLGFSAVNVMKYAKGYFAYRTGKNNNQTDVTAKESDYAMQDKSSPVRKLAKQSTDNITLYPTRPQAGDKIGELYIPKLDATLSIYHGTSEDELEKGVGHYTESVLPGEKDNCVLSGHRDTVFRKLGDIGVGDTLVVTTSAGEFTYKVKKLRIVDANDRTVIVPKPAATLTVSTCYPFDYIGAAPKRYILVAYLASEKLSK